MGVLLATGPFLVAPLAIWGIRHAKQMKLRKRLLKQAIEEFNLEHPKLLMRWNRRPVSKLTIEVRPEKAIKVQLEQAIVVRPEKDQLMQHNLQNEYSYEQTEIQTLAQQENQQKYHPRNDLLRSTNVLSSTGQNTTPAPVMVVDLLTPN